MKSEFPQFFRLSNDQIDNIWKDGVFVFDANVLLNAYRWEDATRERFFEILKSMSDRIWLPHQAALEYLRNRPKVILEQFKSYENIRRFLEDIRKRADAEFKQHERHPLIRAEQLNSQLHKALDDIKVSLEEQHKSHPQLIHEDPHQEFFGAIYEGKVGKAFEDKDLDALYKEGKSRYERKTPPGYSDGNKDGDRKYGDLVLWKQVLRFAKDTKKDIVFVSDDVKEDWLWKEGGRTLGAQPELVAEMKRESGSSFLLYNSPRFIELAAKHFGIKAPASELADARRTFERSAIAPQESASDLIGKIRDLGADLRKIKVRPPIPSAKPPVEWVRLFTQTEEQQRQSEMRDLELLVGSSIALTDDEEKERQAKVRAYRFLAEHPELAISGPVDYIPATLVGTEKQKQESTSDFFEFGPADLTGLYDDVNPDSTHDSGLTKKGKETEQADTQKKSNFAKTHGHENKSLRKNKK